MSPTDFEIIDFHTHPFLTEESNICSHIPYCKMGVAETLETMDGLHISRFCGSVIRRGCTETKEQRLQKILKNNAEALRLQEEYAGRYIAGVHIHPEFVRESCEALEEAAKRGGRLVGELVPYMDGWTEYASDAALEIFKRAEELEMVVSLHTMDEEGMDKLLAACPRLTVVGAHPGELSQLLRHIERAKRFENYHVDVSGTAGYARYGAIRRLVDEIGAERVLFGSDFSTCAPAAVLGGVLLDDTLTDGEKEYIFSRNAKRILNLQ